MGSMSCKKRVLNRVFIYYVINPAGNLTRSQYGQEKSKETYLPVTFILPDKPQFEKLDKDHEIWQILDDILPYPSVFDCF